MHDELVFARALRVSGSSPRSSERAVRSGDLVRVRPGVMIPSRVWKAAAPGDRHRIAMDALAATARRPPIFAVESAAAVHGIPIVGEWPALPRIAVTDGSMRRPRVLTSVRWGPVPESEIVDVGDYRATTPARTVLALAAERGAESGVVAIDHVVRRCGISLEALRSWTDAHRPFSGVRHVDVSLRIATGTSESVLESLSLLRMHQLGFPRPEQQVEFRVDGASFRVDFVWPEYGVIGEADGRSKYDSAPADVVWEEKIREDALRSVSSGFARWNWGDAWAGGGLARKLERAGLIADPRNASKYAFRMRG